MFLREFPLDIVLNDPGDWMAHWVGDSQPLFFPVPVFMQWVYGGSGRDGGWSGVS